MCLNALPLLPGRTQINEAASPGVAIGDLDCGRAIRTFSDTKLGAYEVARELKRRNRGCIIEIRDRSNGSKLIMGEDGRTM